MSAVVQCPNSACGRTSHLADDPLGRIFRCPHCRRRLPSAPASASDSRWTGAIGGWHPTGRQAGLSGNWAWPAVPIAGQLASGRSVPGAESDEVLMGESALGYESPCGNLDHPGLGPDDSGEVCVEPFSQTGSSIRSWNSTIGSSASASEPVRPGLVSSAEEPQSAVHSVLGRFCIRGVLGQGQHAIVYRAYDPVLERDVALKVPRQSVLKAPSALARFLAEGKALARLRHPRIVPVYEAGCANRRHYLAMGLIEGQSMAQSLTEGPFNCRSAAEIVANLAEALAYAHTQGVVHRDVKPANIRLDDLGDAYLMDFGIAYHPDSGELPLPPGTILGTPAYVAPEQAQGGQPHVLPASDQYSLGVVLYELLCGQTPFSGPPSYVLFHVIHCEPPPLHHVSPAIPRPLVAICSKALAKNPEHRYGSCLEFALDLKRWLQGEAPLANRRRWAKSRG